MKYSILANGNDNYIMLKTGSFYYKLLLLSGNWRVVYRNSYKFTTKKILKKLLWTSEVETEKVEVLYV